MYESERAPSGTFARDTRLVHAGEPDPRLQGAVVFPIFQSAMYEFGTAEDREEELRYLRYGNTPSQAVVEDKLAEVAGAEEGVVTASGMAAIACTLLGNLSSGDRVLATRGLYGGTRTLFSGGLSDAGIAVDFVDGDDPRSWEEALREETRVFYTETITNPLLRVPDLEAAVRFGGTHDLLTVVDNTFATPMNFRPLEHGFDVSVHSATKYLNGHSDIVAGAVLGSAAQVARAREKLAQLGPSLDPHACFLLHRGLKTLGLRVARQNESARRLAEFLEGHRAVSRVHHPALPSHPRHRRADELFDGAGGMVSFALAGGADAAEAFLRAVSLPVVAPSLGGVETLVTRPAATSHRSLPAAERERLGITSDLIRVSVGIEDASDLVSDFDRALRGGVA